MEKLEIRDVNKENIEDLIDLCVPPNKESDSLFTQGKRLKKKWGDCVIERYGSIAKLAYLNSKPVGMIQYLPRPEGELVAIRCIFVPNKKDRRKGIGRSLLEALLEDMKNPKPYFENNPPSALVVYAFEVWGLYPQHEFLRKMGFRKVKEDDSFLLYYPVKHGFVYSPPQREFIPQEEDKGKALIFFDPSCPFCIYFSKGMKESIEEVAPKIRIRMINEFEEVEEVKKRGKVPPCVVNKKPIESFFMDKDNFQKEVKEALKHE